MLVSRRENQEIHDICVKKLALMLSHEGWMVEAHVPGWPKPPYVNEFVPDVRARKNDETRIIEVETDDTLYEDADQHDAFARFAAENPGVAFSIYLAKSDGTYTFVR